MPGCCQCEGFRRLADLSVMRGLPVARGFIPVGLQNSPKTCQHGFYRPTACEQIAPAAQPSGDSLWRGDSSPLGCKAAPKLASTVSTGTPHVSKLRLLRSRAGINPLATSRLCTSRDVVCVRKKPTYSIELLCSEPAGIPKRVITEVIDQPGSQGIIDDIAGDGLQVLAVTDRTVVVAGLPQRSVTSGFSVNRMRTASLYTANDFTK